MARFTIGRRIAGKGAEGLAALVRETMAPIRYAVTFTAPGSHPAGFLG